MPSVTQIINTISQPRGGFVPKSLFEETKFEDFNVLKEIKSDNNSLASIQGLAVDYLTRYLLTKDKTSAFHISFLGAVKLDETFGSNNEVKKYLTLLENINGLDDKSIFYACQIVGYDVAFRSDLKTYRNVNEIKPSKEMVSNIRIMVYRGLYFLEKYGPVIADEMTFEGGYTELVNSGDGDYLTKNMIIDFKVTQKSFSNKWSLQLLMYYILGIHSIHLEYKNVNKLCIFNPLENVSYIVNVSDISDKTKYLVSNKVIGYKMEFPEVYTKWESVNGTDNCVLQEFLNERVKSTYFDITKYDDGIHYISVNEYWSFLRQIDFEYRNKLRPIFRFTNRVIMIKKGTYKMFFSESYKGKISLLNGGQLKSVPFPIEYYYENIEKYGNAIILRFSKYWDALRLISKQLISLTPEKKSSRIVYEEEKAKMSLLGMKIPSFNEWYEKIGKYRTLSGRIHGCIVDLDYWNHIYINPYDGTLTPYNAVSMYDKNVYKNTKSLIATQRPEMLESFNRLLESGTNSLLTLEQGKKANELVFVDNEIDEQFTKIYAYDMYAISNKLKGLQKIYDFGIVQNWYDEILNIDKILIENKQPNKTVKKNNNKKNQKLKQQNPKEQRKKETIDEQKKIKVPLIKEIKTNDLKTKIDKKKIK